MATFQDAFSALYKPCQVRRAQWNKWVMLDTDEGHFLLKFVDDNSMRLDHHAYGIGAKFFSFSDITATDWEIKMFQTPIKELASEHRVIRNLRTTQSYRVSGIDRDQGEFRGETQIGFSTFSIDLISAIDLEKLKVGAPFREETYIENDLETGQKYLCWAIKFD